MLRQGHTVRVELGYPPAEPPDFLFHGTAEKNVSSILQHGLLKGSRHHVHLSVDSKTAEIVGKRHGRPEVQVGPAGDNIFFIRGIHH
ncbi:MAG: RNA 2'-phosphotransferase [Spirochaetales bacterium]|nr:RNA 2'-phosphotransferase [Spirochaetales bacterium]